MDTIEIAAKMVRDAVTAMSTKFSEFVKAGLDDKQDVATMPTKVSDFTNDVGFQDAQQVEDKIDAKISSAYKAGGSATMLTLPALTAAKLGVVVNMSEDFTTTSDFLEGAGKTYPAGTNVVVALAGENTYKYDVLAGFVDLSGYVQDTRKVGNVPLSADIPVSLTGDTAIAVTNTGTASAIGYSVSHANSGVTAGSKGDASAQTPGFGGTFKALSATVDAKGHVISLGDHNVTVPSATATSQANGLMSSSDKAKLDALSVTASDPLEVTKTGETYNVTLKDSGVTAGSKGDTTNQTPGFGGAFKALSATVDAKGRVTALAEHNVTVPNSAATQSAAGLMSAADKSKLDAYASKGSATKGVYIDANGAPQPMTYSLNADVPTNFAPATAAPLMDGTAAVGNSAKYAREDHRHETDTSRASAADVAAIKTLLQTAVLYRTASGNPATFSDGAAENLRKLVVTLAPTQSGSGDPYPPGGGNNLFHPTERAWMSVDGMKNTDTTCVSGWVPVVAGETYTASAETAIYGIGMTFCSENSEGHPVGSSPRFNNTNSASLTVVAPAGAAYAYLNMNANRTSAAATSILNGTDTTYLLKFERGSQRTPYANIRPISSVSSVTVTRADGNGGNSQSVTVALADGNNNPLAVYGGTLDVTTGTLSVTHAFYEFANGSAWTQGQAGTVNQYFTAPVSVAANNQTARNENFLCSHFTWASIWSGSTAYGISIYDSGVYFRNLSLFPTLADFSAWIDAQYANGTPLQVCYPINAPVTYTLTAQQLAALAGYNSVSADSGTLEVEYRADVGLSIDGLESNLTNALLSLGAGF